MAKSENASNARLYLVGIGFLIGLMIGTVLGIWLGRMNGPNTGQIPCPACYFGPREQDGSCTLFGQISWGGDRVYLPAPLGPGEGTTFGQNECFAVKVDNCNPENAALLFQDVTAHPGSPGIANPICNTDVCKEAVTAACGERPVRHLP